MFDIWLIVFLSRLVLAVSRKLEQNISNGSSPEDSWNNCSVELVRAAQVNFAFSGLIKYYINALKGSCDILFVKRRAVEM